MFIPQAKLAMKGVLTFFGGAVPSFSPPPVPAAQPCPAQPSPERSFSPPPVLAAQPSPVLKVILAGPVTSFRIGDNQRLRDAFKYYTSDLNNAMSQATFGYQLGAGLDLGNFSLDVRKEGSFTNLASFQVSGQQAAGGSVKQKVTSWQVTLGLKLF